MPELPEVETVKRSLEKLHHKTIKKATVIDGKLRYPVPKRSFEKSLQNRTITAIWRRSKYVGLTLDDKDWLIVHLGMSGRFYLENKKRQQEKHLRVVFDLAGTEELRFVDPRRFGIVEFIPQKDVVSYKRFLKLGPEPLSEDFSVEYLIGRAIKSVKPIKNLIMDAQVVVGIGNIYACESLFLAGIHPGKRSQKISKAKIAALVKASKNTLKSAIKQGGTTVNDFRDGQQKKGYFQVSLAVYGRKGEPCTKCRTPIQNLKLAGRSSFFCPRCQRLS